MNVLLSLVVKPELEDLLTDWLLMHDEVKGFSSQILRGHGNKSDLSLSEQVTGLQKQIMFICVLDEHIVKSVLHQLKQDFFNAHMHYWLTPVLEHGTL